MQRGGMELGFQEIALAVLAVVFLILLIMILLSVIDPGTSAVEVFGKRSEGLFG